MHKKDIGTIGELRIALDLKKQGYPVFSELGDNSVVDLIVLVNFIPVRVQVKTVPKLESNRAVLNLRSTGPGSYSKKYSNTEIDVFALHVIESDDIIYISSCEALKK